MKLAFPAATPVTVPVLGGDLLFPVRRVFCVGRNYAEHAREMGAAVERGRPVFFTKPADALVPGGGAIAYPSATTELHHEVELVVALGSGGRDIAPSEALSHVFGYAVGIDLTRRDLQAEMKAKSLPWDIAKGFDHSAPISAIRRAEATPPSGFIRLEVNGTLRQQGRLTDMVYGVHEVIAELSKLFELKAGDLVFMGTPSGVAALQPGDRFLAEVEGLARLEGSIAPR
ncbi:MAG TPA: fumarylacetoacetate hydrolase family protein [Xanthomonadaceae bacterium]|nr:fumarylacetoacetate hydrolase family protein [Xanthomonadaceae bacterium]